MIEFLYHDGIQKEIVVFERRFHRIWEGFKSFERLCEIQFHPASPRQVIAPAKLHRIMQNDVWTMWKIELVIPGSGLRPSQYPRMWFVVRGAIIAFLCISSHADNYKDKDMNRLALLRTTDLF